MPCFIPCIFAWAMDIGCLGLIGFMTISKIRILYLLTGCLSKSRVFQKLIRAWQKACFYINTPLKPLPTPYLRHSNSCQKACFYINPLLTPSLPPPCPLLAPCQPPKLSRSLLAALSIAVSNSPAKTAVLITSKTPTKSFSAPTSTACLPFASSNTFVP